jgi:hypothetical protein
MRILIAGWFSFEEMGATAGDLFARDLVADWLAAGGIRFDIATAPPFSPGVDWRQIDPAGYSHVVFVCGPFGNGWPITDFLERFAGSRLIGLNLSLIQELNEWNPFDLLVERDSSRNSRPDIVFLSDCPKVPVVGVVQVHWQGEYGADRATHSVAHAEIERLLATRDVARVDIDTRLDRNARGLRSPHEVESLLARTDVVVTTRLHGLVLALKNAIPALAVDAIAGGAKLHRQAQAIGWPAIVTSETLSEGKLAEFFDWCLTDQARTAALRCRDFATARLATVRGELMGYLECQLTTPR